MSDTISNDTAAALLALEAARGASPDEAARHEARIRFGLARLEELDASSGERGVTRSTIARQILDGHLRRAKEFADGVASGEELEQAA
jgi:hypothetical protein